MTTEPKTLVPCELPQHAGLWLGEDGQTYRLGGSTQPAAVPAYQPMTDEEAVAIVREASRGAATRRDGTTSTRIVRATESAVLARVAAAPAAVPSAVLAWRDAYAAYIAATDSYNSRLVAIRAREAQFPHEFGRDNPDAEWHAMNAAEKLHRSLIAPMYEALTAAAPAAAPVADAEFIHDQLWGDGAECCGRPVVGAEYMGQQEMVCCGEPERAGRTDEQIVAALRQRFPFCTYCGGNDETPTDHCMDCTRPKT